MNGSTPWRSNNSLRAILPRLLPLALIAAGILPVIVLGLQNPAFTIDAYLWRVLKFTITQAALSTALSLALGLPFALALSRTSCPGRKFIVRLLALPLALPAIVATLGIVAAFGKIMPLYGLAGILIAHVFFNFPLVARLALASLDAIPDDTHKLAAQLAFSPGQYLRHVEWPAIKPMIPGATLLVFLLCAASFTIVLTLGGGPQATTLEVAIYQALRFDFDPARATALALIQMALCALLIVAASKFPAVSLATHAVLRPHHLAPASLPSRIISAAALVIGASLLLPPLAAVIWAGLPGLAAQWPAAAALTSIALGATSAALALGMCWPLAAAASRARNSSSTTQAIILSGWILPPAIIATGWFILLSRFGAVGALAPILIVTLNALMAMPFCYNAMAPAFARHAAASDRLCASLGLTGWNRLWCIDLPALRRPLALGLVMAAIVSLGDLTAVLFFGNGGIITLPALIYAQMGNYRMHEAAATSLLLALLAFALLSLAERLSDHD